MKALSRGWCALVLLSFATLAPCRADEPSGDTVDVPAAEREELAHRLEKMDIQGASLLRKTGKVTVDQAEMLGVFELVTGAQTFYECYRKNDPTYCQRYLRDGKSPSTYAGLLLFSGAAWATTHGTIRLLGDKASSRMWGGYLGLASGVLVNDLFMDIVHRKASLSETLGSGDWWKEKTPEIGTNLAAAVAAQYTNQGLSALSARIPPMNCFFENLNRGLESRPVLKFAKNSLGKAGQLSLFMAYSELFQTGSDLSGRLLSDGAIHKDLARVPRNQAELNEIVADWDLYRRKKMGQAEKILTLHRESMSETDSSIAEPFLFYSWFQSGMKEDESWKRLRDNYYSKKSTPHEIHKDAEKFAKAFFCGPSPKEAYHPSEDWRGLPIPGRSFVKVDAYRVVPERDEELCSGPLETILARVTNPSYSERVLKADRTLRATSSEDRLKKVERYEASVRDQLLLVLNGKPRAQNPGVLPSFDQEIASLQKMEKQVKDPQLLTVIQKNIEIVRQTRSTVQGLADYITHPAPKSQTTKGQGSDATVPDVFDEIVGDSSPAQPPAQDAKKQTEDPSAAVKYFNGYILRNDL